MKKLFMLLFMLLILLPVIAFAQVARDVNVTISYDAPDPIQQITSAKIFYRTLTAGTPDITTFQEVVVPTNTSNTVVLNLLGTTSDSVQIQLALCNIAGCSAPTTPPLTQLLALAAPAATTPVGVIVTNSLAP